MENNRIRTVIVDHYIMKKETIRHIFVIWDTEVMNEIFMVVIATELEQNVLIDNK